MFHRLKQLQNCLPWTVTHFTSNDKLVLTGKIAGTCTCLCHGLGKHFGKHVMYEPVLAALFIDGCKPQLPVGIERKAVHVFVLQGCWTEARVQRTDKKVLRCSVLKRLSTASPPIWPWAFISFLFTKYADIRHVFTGLCYSPTKQELNSTYVWDNKFDWHKKTNQKKPSSVLVKINELQIISNQCFSFLFSVFSEK